jgi:hypothetical protein
MTALHATFALLATLTTRAGRRVARGARDAGASALEFAIIAAIVVVAASVIGAVIYNVVETKSTDLQTCADQAVSAKCTP